MSYFIFVTKISLSFFISSSEACAAMRTVYFFYMAIGTLLFSTWVTQFVDDTQFLTERVNYVNNIFKDVQCVFLSSNTENIITYVYILSQLNFLKYN